MLPWKSRVKFQFFAFAAKIMRHILVDHARGKLRGKRGAGALKISIADVNPLTPEPDLDLMALDEALNTLAVLDPKQTQIVELRFFGGLTIDEVAEVLGISPATTKREWDSAKLWLRRQLDIGGNSSSPRNAGNK